MHATSDLFPLVAVYRYNTAFICTHA